MLRHINVIDNYDARMNTLDAAPMKTITVVYNDEVGYSGWYAEYKHVNEYGRTVYERGLGATPEEATINLLCAVSGDESSRI